MIGGLLTHLIFAKFKRVSIMRRAKTYIMAGLLVVSVLGLLMVLAEYQSVGAIQTRFWPLFLLWLSFLLGLFAWFSWLKYLPDKYQSELAQRREFQKARKRHKR
jgi:hypothetical protein